MQTASYKVPTSQVLKRKGFSFNNSNPFFDPVNHSIDSTSTEEDVRHSCVTFINKTV